MRPKCSFHLALHSRQLSYPKRVKPSQSHTHPYHSTMTYQTAHVASKHLIVVIVHHHGEGTIRCRAATHPSTMRGRVVVPEANMPTRHARQDTSINRCLGGYIAINRPTTCKPYRTRLGMSATAMFSSRLRASKRRNRSTGNARCSWPGHAGQRQAGLV